MGPEGQRARSLAAAHRPYCLSCYAALEPEPGAGTCSACGFLNAKLDLERFWTKERRLAALERAAKGVILALLALFGLALLAGSAGPDLGLGWTVGLPIAVGVLLWETASKITRRRPAFPATPLCAALIVVFAAAFAGLSLAPNVPVRGRLLGACLVVALLGGTGAVVALGRLLERWRDRYVLDGQARARLRPDAHGRIARYKRLARR